MGVLVRLRVLMFVGVYVRLVRVAGFVEVLRPGLGAVFGGVLVVGFVRVLVR